MCVEFSLITILQSSGVKRLICVPSVLCAANVDEKEAAEGEGIT